jgi:branched-chain amino acid transport system substrate-binding protein
VGQLRIWMLLAGVFMVVTGRGAVLQAAETKGPVTDEVGVVQIKKGEPIVIGGYWVLSGPDTGLGLDQKRAVEVAIDELGGKLLDHPIRFMAEDSQCNAEGGQVAATKLASNRQIVLVLGPSCSSEATPGAPILWKAGIPSISTSASAPSLTDPKRPEEFFGLARTIPNDKWQGAADAKWAYQVAGLRAAATIHDGSPYASQLVAVFADEFRKLGGKITAQEAVAPTDTDMRPVLTRIATGKPDMLYYPIFVGGAAQVTRQVKTIPGLEKTMPVGGGALLTADLIEAAGDAVVGFRITYPDVSPEVLGKGYPDFVKRYKQKYGENPIQGFHANAYDGAMIGFKAITKVAKQDSQGNLYIGRKALRDAIFATKEHPGLTGTLSCDRYGDCGIFHPAVYQYTNADPKTFKLGANPIKIYPK